MCEATVLGGCTFGCAHGGENSGTKITRIPESDADVTTLSYCVHDHCVGPFGWTFHQLRSQRIIVTPVATACAIAAVTTLGVSSPHAAASGRSPTHVAYVPAVARTRGRLTGGR